MGTASQLKPYHFKPGQSGNPGGRPKKEPVTDYLRSQMEQPIPQSMLDAMKEGARQVFCEVYGDKPNFGQMLAFKLVQQSAKGDIFAMKELLERVEGKVTQRTIVEADVTLSDRLKEARVNASRSRAK